MKTIRLFLTGEGKSDIGYVDVQSEEFVPREMTFIADAVICHAAYPEEISIRHEFMDKNELTGLLKKSPVAKRQSILTDRLTLVSAKDSKFPGLWIRAKVWGDHVRSNGGTIGVMFTDADRTNSEVRGKWRQKFEAIAAGFAQAGFDGGVPMVPQPKSEAWLLAYYQKNMGHGHCAYQNCARFENLSGTDDPTDKNSAKVLLSTLLNGSIPNKDELLNVEWQLVDMPSFNAFRGRMEQVVRAVSAKVF